MADFRCRCPANRIMLIVGGFHVTHDGGTAQKLRARRPSDRVITVAYSSTTDSRLAFDPEDCGAGDIIVYGIQPPPEPKSGRPGGMPPMTRPASAPASASAPSTAATAPADQSETKAPAGMPAGMPANRAGVSRP